MAAVLVSNHQGEHGVEVGSDRSSRNYTRPRFAMGRITRRHLGHWRIPLADHSQVDAPSSRLRSLQRGTLTRSLRIVQCQKSFYRLALQEVVVCRTPRKFPNIEPDFTEQVFDQSTRRKWLPLYVGCCSYKFRRHVAIIIAQQDERGSLISQAALIQSRREFLRSNWTKIGKPSSSLRGR